MTDLELKTLKFLPFFAQFVKTRYLFIVKCLWNYICVMINISGSQVFFQNLKILKIDYSMIKKYLKICLNRLILRIFANLSKGFHPIFTKKDEHEPNGHTKKRRRPEFWIFDQVDFYLTLNVENVEKNINGQNALSIHLSNFIIFLL